MRDSGTARLSLHERKRSDDDHADGDFEDDVERYRSDLAGKSSRAALGEGDRRKDVDDDDDYKCHGAGSSGDDGIDEAFPNIDFALSNVINLQELNIAAADRAVQRLKKRPANRFPGSTLREPAVMND